MTDSPKSPCIEVGALDARAGRCTGSGRSLVEIAEWVLRAPKWMAQRAAGLPVIL
jgi:predicted Fe-S protein YdhL (DUF1289 family)